MRYFRALAWLTLVVALTGSDVGAAGTMEFKDWRALHLIGFDSDGDLATLGKQLPALAKLGINVIILEVDYSFAYKSHPELRDGNDLITFAGARQLVAQCRANHIQLIPQFQCLGHQSWKKRTGPFLKKYPELDLTPGAFPGNQGLYCREWAPLNPRVNQIIFALMDELIDAFQAEAFHVGMDEIFLIGSDKSPSTRGKDPAVIFAKAVNDYHTHLTGQRHVQMLMWADRLIDGRQFNLGEWEASQCGTAPAVDRVPKDIILCPWHYERHDSYPSIPYLTGKGFRVLPAGWKEVAATKALIQYEQRQHNPRIIGHLFTTWGEADNQDLAAFPPLIAGLRLLLPPMRK